jgi:hypothetical protein
LKYKKIKFTRWDKSRGDLTASLLFHGDKKMENEINQKPNNSNPENIPKLENHPQLILESPKPKSSSTKVKTKIALGIILILAFLIGGAFLISNRRKTNQKKQAVPPVVQQQPAPVTSQQPIYNQNQESKKVPECNNNEDCYICGQKCIPIYESELYDCPSVHSQLGCACKNNKCEPKGEMTELKTYRNDEYGFELKYPPELSPKNNERSEVKLSNIQEFRNIKTDCLQNLEHCATPVPVFSVSYFKNDKNRNILDLIQEREDFYGDLDYEKINISNVEFIKVVSGDMYLADSYYTEKNGIVVELEFSYDAGNKDLQLNKLDVDRILSTFRFISPNKNSNTSTKNSVKKINEIRNDKNNWITYINSNSDYSVGIPSGGSAAEYSNGTVYVCYKTETGRCLIIETKKISINDFITEFEQKDPGISKILKRENYTFEDLKGYKLIGSTAIGINSSIIFVIKNGSSYIIDYQETDKNHLEIVSTFKFIK